MQYHMRLILHPFLPCIHPSHHIPFSFILLRIVPRMLIFDWSRMVIVLFSVFVCVVW